MIAYTTFLLFFIGIVSSIKVGVKVDRIFSMLSFASLFFIFLYFCKNWMIGNEQVFSFMWNSSPGGDIKIDIISNPYNYSIIFPFFLMTLSNIAHNQMFRYEEKRSTYNALLIFNLTALCMMITSNNFVQLLSAVFIIDILAFFLINNADIYRYYALINLSADMLLFMVLATINSFVDSLDIRQIIEYKKNAYHIDFITILGLTAVFMKLGFFPFGLGLSKLKTIRLHRLQNILFLSAPVTAIVLLLKFHTLWKTSDYFSVYLNIGCIITMIFSFFGSIAQDNFKAKIIYWQLIFWVLFIEILKFNGFVWSIKIVPLLLSMYILVNGLYWLYYLFNRRLYVTQMINIKIKNHFKIEGIFIIILLAILLMASILFDLYNNINRYYIWTFAVLFIFSLSGILGQIIFTPRKSDNLQTDKMSIHLNYGLELLLLSGILLHYFYINNSVIWAIFILFTILSLVNPLRKLINIYQINWLQKSEGLIFAYNWLVKTFVFSGKILWLLIDYLFMEKIVIASIKNFCEANIRSFRQLHHSRLGGIITASLLLLILLWISYLRGDITNG